MYQQIIIVDEPRIADLLDCSIERRMPREYQVLKAASVTELFHWLALTVPSYVNSIVLGLSLSENTDIIDTLTEWHMRDDYNIVLLGERGYVQDQQHYLKANASIEKYPKLQQDNLYRMIRRFDKITQLV